MTPKQEYDAMKARERAEHKREEDAKLAAHDIMLGLAKFFRGEARVRGVPVLNQSGSREIATDYYFVNLKDL